MLTISFMNALKSSKPASKAAALRTALLTLLREHEAADAIPTSNRFLYYELIQRGIVSKEAKTPKPGRKGCRRSDQNTIDALLILRESGEHPWDWIVDETRSLDDYVGSRTICEAVLERLSVLRLDPWGSEVRPPMVLTESRSLAGVLRSLVWEYAARIASTNGQCGGFLRTVIAPQLQENDRVLYFGDWDRVSSRIKANTKRVLKELVGNLRWERLALTEEQVKKYDLPIIEKTDSRYKGGRGLHQAVETEALSQTISLSLVNSSRTCRQITTLSATNSSRAPS